MQKLCARAGKRTPSSAAPRSAPKARLFAFSSARRRRRLPASEASAAFRARGARCWPKGTEGKRKGPGNDTKAPLRWGNCEDLNIHLYVYIYNMYMRVCVCVHVCIYIYIYVHICMCIYIYIQIYIISIHICIHIDIYIYRYIYIYVFVHPSFEVALNGNKGKQGETRATFGQRKLLFSDSPYE